MAKRGKLNVRGLEVTKKKNIDYQSSGRGMCGRKTVEGEAMQGKEFVIAVGWCLT
jgi:hypothetical protein